MSAEQTNEIIICGKCFLPHKRKDRIGHKKAHLFKICPDRKCKGGWYF